MDSIDLNGLELLEVWPKSAPERRIRFTFPISAQTGAKRSSVAYAELPSGSTIPSHIDSANEVVLVLDGPVDLEIDGESASVPTGRLVQIPSATRHCVTNTGTQTVRLVFFFDEAADVVTFDEPLKPLDRAVLGGHR
jgi:quercetin dioxygenase-like cupin family protein